MSVLTHKRDRIAHRRDSQTSPRPIGLLAGSGRFPILFAEAAKRQGLSVACVGIRYEAHESLRELCSTRYLVDGEGQVRG